MLSWVWRLPKNLWNLSPWWDFFFRLLHHIIFIQLVVSVDSCVVIFKLSVLLIVWLDLKAWQTCNFVNHYFVTVTGHPGPSCCMACTRALRRNGSFAALHCSLLAHCSIDACCSCLHLLAAYPGDCLLFTGCRTDHCHDWQTNSRF